MKLIGELRQLVKAGDKVASVKSMENSVGDENDPTAILLKSLKHYQTSLVKGNIEVDLIEAEKILQGQLNRAKFRVEHDSKEIEQALVDATRLILTSIDSTSLDHMIIKPATPCFTDYQIDTLFSYDGLTGELNRRRHEKFSFKEYKSVQVIDDLYSISEKPHAVWRYTGLVDQTDIVHEQVALADQNRKYFTISNVQNQALYITGGKVNGHTSNTCLVFTIETGILSDSIAMNEPRWGHSSTGLADSVYVFGGFNGGQLSTIEILNTATDLSHW